MVKRQAILRGLDAHVESFPRGNRSRVPAHGRREAVPITVKAVRETYNANPVMPVIDGEAAYEMLSDSLPTEWTRAMFWLCLMNGAKGHTYGANGIWQLNRPGQPHGPSPTANSRMPALKHRPMTIPCTARPRS